MDSNYGFNNYLSNAGAGQYTQYLPADQSLGAGADDFDFNGWVEGKVELPVADFNALLASINQDTSSSYASGASSAPGIPALDTLPAPDYSFTPGIPALDALSAPDSSFIQGMPALDASYAPASPQADSGVPFADDDATTLHSKFCEVSAPESLTAPNYAPQPHVVAEVPEVVFNSSPLYKRLTSPRFRSSAEAKEHRKQARMGAKSEANDIARVKSFGRDYWVRRIYNAMICTQKMTDSASSVHRARFTKLKVFDELDLEAAAHNVFDKAIAVHERGWNRPNVYHKKTVRGKLVDKSEKSVEMRLSMICLLLQNTKSAVDDVMRGGLTLALLCDNPQARMHTKISNDVGNAKRGARLKQTSTKKDVVEGDEKKEAVEGGEKKDVVEGGEKKDVVEGNEK
jgi:hypothetical protein